MGVADVPQYVGSRVAPSHGHIFNFSHEISPSPSSGHSHSHAQSQGHGHGLSLSHLPHSEQQQQQPDHPNDLQQEVMSQKPHFIQSHQQSQHGFAMSMNVQKAPPPLPQQQSEALQSSQIKQVQVDNNHHQKKQQQQQQQQVDHVQQQHATILQQQQQETTLELAHDSSPPRALHLSLDKGLIIGEGSLDGEEEGEREGAGSRWPKQEAIALLKIRSDMDAAFRESNLKGPLWEEISRKLADMGYHRTAKKCKEKFENVHKYYKRTKDGKIGRQDGKNYRFFSQLEALYGKAAADINNSTNLSNKNLNISTPPGLLTAGNINNDNGVAGLGLIDAARNINRPSLPSTGNTTSADARTAHIVQTLETVESFKHDSDNSSRLNFSYESSDEDELDGPVEGGTENASSRKRKRKSVKKYLVFFENVMKKVLDKQEQMQQKFLEALERRDQDRMIREEAWKMQEISMLNREHDLRAQERALSASHDVSLVAVLQKMTGQTLALPHIALNSNHQPSAAIIPADDIQDDYQHDKHDPTSKRWPKPEVLALIKLRTTLDKKFHEPGSKAVLWEEISAGMSSQGYSRTAKRCKEKWENINKYFKKAKESNKKRPENAKTCPYFHHLNALYKEGLLSGGGSNISSKQLMVIEKGDEHPEDVLEQGNTSNTREDISGQALQEGDPEILAIEEIEGPGLNPTPTAATTSATVTATKAPTTTTASNDATMQLFMSSDNRGNNASIKKVITSNDSQPITDSAIGNHPATTNSSPLVLERMDSSIILSGPAKQPSG